jgi:uncharacterized protein
MNRRTSIQRSALASTVTWLSAFPAAARTDFPVVRPPAAALNFRSKSVEKAIIDFQSKVKDKELAWLFENCFPNTLDTTVTFRTIDGRPDTEAAGIGG